MITYFDTSVIFGALDPGQEIHQQSLLLLNEAKGKGVVVTTTLHTYAELYNNITKAGGGRPNMPPEEAAKLLIEVVGSTFEMIELDKADYELGLKRCAKLALTRSVIYDALHLQAAIKAGADVLYTNNLKDFTRLITKDDKIKIKGVR